MIFQVSQKFLCMSVYAGPMHQDQSELFNSPYQNICQICCTIDNYKYKPQLHYSMYQRLWQKVVYFSTFLAVKLDFTHKSIQYGWICVLSFFLFLVVPHMQLLFGRNTWHFALKTRRSRLFAYTFVLAHGRAVLNINVSLARKGIPLQYGWQ